MSLIKLDITVDGLDDVKRYLDKVLPNIIEEAYKDALLTSARDAKEIAKSLVPVDTGALRNSIRVFRWAKESRRIRYTGISAGGYVRNPKTNRLVDYQRHVEYGTSRQRAQPFMRPAVDKVLPKIKGRFWRNVKSRTEQP